MNPKLLPAALLSLLLVTPASAECLLANATYGQAETSYVLQFTPRTSETPVASSNLFTLTVPVEGKRLELAGEVIWGNGIAVPGGFIWQECLTEPAENEPDWCTYWDGIVYGIGGDKAFELPEETAPAPKGLLLTDLGRTLNYSSLVLEEIPADYFELRGCK
jgi:hypothetical protein